MAQHHQAAHYSITTASPIHVNFTLHSKHSITNISFGNYHSHFFYQVSKGFPHDISDPEQKESLLVRLEDFRNSYPYGHLILKVSADLADEAPMYHQLILQLISTMEVQKRAFEQRAWVFFDDARLYPSRSIARHFPSTAYIENDGDKLV
ncbi:hypothetical protein FVER53590_26491 [Fusarium verticillioides]|nr:hypothetical protein FVER53590_26491 [Fusarium verticillioides]